MNLFERCKQLTKSLIHGIRRFPASILISLAVAFILIRMNHFPSDTATAITEAWQRALTACLMGFPVSLSVHLLLERTARPPLYKPVPLPVTIVSFAAATAILFSYAWFLLPNFKMVPMVRTILLTGALVLLFICTPYWWRRAGLALHTTRLLVRMLVTGLYSGILMLALFAILFTLDKLLAVPVTDHSYIDTAILVWAVFAPFHFLAGIPGVREVPKPVDSPKTLRFLLHWILIPLLWVYTAILYVYSAKILIEREWPHGIVSSLILAYACIGLLVWFLSSPTVEDGKLAVFHHRWYAWSALPLFFILFAAIGIRVGEYGLTEPRWFVLILSGWCAAAMLFIAIRSLFRKRDAEKAGLRIILLPVSLALVAVCSVAGPFSAFSLSIRSQNRELESIFARNGMLSAGKAVKPAGTVSEADQARIASILDWFGRDHDLADAKVLPEGFVLADMKDKLGLSLANTGNATLYKYVRFSVENMAEPLDIKGYDFMYPFGPGARESSDPASGFTFRMDADTQDLVLSRNGNEVYRADLKERLRLLVEAHGSGDSQGKDSFTLAQKDLSFDTVAGDLRIRLMIRQIDGNSQPGAETGFKPGYAEGWLLVDLP